MIERLEPMLKLVKKPKKPFVVNPYEDVDKAMVRDGMSSNAISYPLSTLGSKAWIIYQIVSAVPPSYYTAWNQPPDELIKLAAASDWSDAIIGGWIEANKRMPDADWAFALTNYWVFSKNPMASSSFLQPPVEQVRVADYEKLIIKLLDANVLPIDSSVTMWLLNNRIHSAWSEKFARTVVDCTKGIISKSSEYQTSTWSLRALFKDWAIFMPTHLLEEFNKDWPPNKTAYHGNSWDSIVEQFLAIFHFRVEMLKEINS